MGTIRKRGAYSYQVQVRRRGYPTQTRTFETKSAAEKWARDVEREYDQGIYTDRKEAEKNTLYMVLDRYKKEIVPNHRGSEVEGLRIDAILRHPITKLKMAALSTRHLAEYRDERLQSVSGSTVNRELNIISAAINHARKEWGIHVENPIALLKRPKENRARERRFEGNEEQRLLQELTFVPKDEMGRFAKGGCRNRWVKPLVQLALETAMRRGELLSLDWQYVDLSRACITLPMTKNGESRKVPLSMAAIEILKSIPRALAGRVFPTTESALKQAFTRACERAKIANLHFHDLRHEATSRLAEKLPNVIELANVTGHKDLKMLKRYYHPRVEDLAKKLG